MMIDERRFVHGRRNHEALEALSSRAGNMLKKKMEPVLELLPAVKDKLALGDMKQMLWAGLSDQCCVAGDRAQRARQTPSSARPPKDSHIPVP